MRIVRGEAFRRVLSLAVLILLIIQIPFLLSSAEVQAAQIKQLSIILTDSPNSPLAEFFAQVFPEAEITYQLAKDELDVRQHPALILMPEHQAYPLLEQGIGSGFLPLFRASLICGEKREKSELFRLEEPQTWEELLEKDLKVASIVPQRYLVAALNERLDENKSQLVLDRLGELYAKSEYEIYNSVETPKYKAHTELLESEELPDLILAFDYHLVHLNQGLTAKDKSGYALKVPAEGSIFIDYGLFATDRNAYNLLEQRLGSRASENTREELLDLGYRLPDGASRKEFGYPDQEAYFTVSRIKNYYTFNESEMSDLAQFRRGILGFSRLAPASMEGEFISYLLLTIAFMIWMAFLFYRLDEPLIRLPLRLYLGALAIWILVRMGELLLPRQNRVYAWYTYLPVFLIAAAWLFLAWRQVTRRRVENKNLKRMLYGSASLLGAALILALSNRYHNLIFDFEIESAAYEGYGIKPAVMLRAGPLLYPLILILLLNFLLGFYFLYHAREQKTKWILTYLPLALIILSFAYNGFYLIKKLNLESAAFTRNNAIFAALLLELTLQGKFLPANTKYFRFFRYNPLSMRLISRNLDDVYAPDNLADLSRAEKISLRKLIRNEFKQDERRNSRFGLKKPNRPRKISDKVARLELDSEDKILSLKEIHGGYLLWLEDVSDLHMLRNRLTDLSERLEQQQNILRQEQNVQTQLASQKIRRVLFGALEQQLSEKMQEITDLINQLKDYEAQGQSELIKPSLARLRMLVSQAKRKSNLLVRQEPSLELDELRLIFKEALQDAESAGITGIVVVQGEGSIDTQKAIFFYDYVQELLQNNADLERLSVFLMLAKSEEKVQLRLMLNADQLLESKRYRLKPNLQARLEELGAHVDVSSEDQDLRLQIEIKEEPNA